MSMARCLTEVVLFLQRVDVTLREQFLVRHVRRRAASVTVSQECTADDAMSVLQAFTTKHCKDVHVSTEYLIFDVTDCEVKGACASVCVCVCALLQRKTLTHERFERSR